MNAPRHWRVLGAWSGHVAFFLLMGFVYTQAPAQQCLQWSNYFVCQQTFMPQDSRYPRINNNGQFVYQRQVGGQWQIFGSGNLGPLTSAGADYTDATSPAIADDGSFLCYRHAANGGLGFVVKYPGAHQIEFSIHAEGGDRDAGEHPSMSSSGEAIWWYSFYNALTGDSVRRLFISGRGQVQGPDWEGDYPDVNAKGDYVFHLGGQIYHSAGFVVADGAYPHIGDAPADSPDVVYVSGTELRSTVTGVIGPGSWVDVNRSGIIVFEYRTNGFIQIFKGYPLPRIVSNGGTNAVVGLPYQYDSDNKAEAYGYSENDDPFGSGRIVWSVLPGPGTPPDFTINTGSGEVTWTPMQEGTNRVTIAAENNYGVSTQFLTIVVTKPTFELADAMAFPPPGSPGIDPNQYFVSGQTRVGVVADGASRLVVRVKLEGFDPTDPNLHLRFAIENSTGNDGSLSAVSSMSWAEDVPAEFATDGTIQKAVCIYESPRDYGPASKPVTILLQDGSRILARKEIQIRRPPVVLVHGTFSKPATWTALPPKLRALGYSVDFVDYEGTHSAHFAENIPKIYIGARHAISNLQAAGFAASQVDLVAHSMGGVLCRFHIQSASRQAENYFKGDVHKLITLGATHWGSYWAGVGLTVKQCNPGIFQIIRSGLLLGTGLSWDLDGGAVEDQVPGSPALLNLRTTTIFGHSFASSVASAPDGTWRQDPIQSLLFLLNIGIIGDGVVSEDSARGGIDSRAYSFNAGIIHTELTTDENIANQVVQLLDTPVGSPGSGEFADFPPSSIAVSDAAIILLAHAACLIPADAQAPASPLPSPPPDATANPRFGTWLAVNGLTNGAPSAGGQHLIISVASTDGRPLSAALFMTPQGALIDSAPPFQADFVMPTNALGSQNLVIVGKDTNGEMSLLNFALSVAATSVLQRIEVIPPALPIATRLPEPLRVFGDYADGVRREITSASTGTKYDSSNRSHVRVDTNGVLRATPLANGAYTIWITNGTVWTNIQVTVDLLNLPPTAIIAASKTNGPAPLDIQFDGTQSRDAELLPITYHWDFGDGTTSELATPPMQRFVVPGQHTVTLTVTDPQGLISIDRFIVTIEPRIVLNGNSLTLTQTLTLNEVVVTNGGSLTVLTNLGVGNVVIEGTNSTFSLGGAGLAESVTLLRGGVLTCPAKIALTLTTSNLTLDASSRLDVSGKGHASTRYNSIGDGPGGGQGEVETGGCGTGAGYGGIGGSVGRGQPGGVYGLFANPTDFGSAGGASCGNRGGSGGGALLIEAGRIHVDGVIAADGETSEVRCWFGVATASGGSGGSVNLRCQMLTGRGVIRANGAMGIDPQCAGLGGGGRVAIYYGDKSGFTGTIQAWGGRNTNSTAQLNGGAGTVYLQKLSEAQGTLVVDNGGAPTEGWSTVLANGGPIDLAELSLGSSVSVDVLAPVRAVRLVNAGTNSLRVLPGATVGEIALRGINQLTFAGTSSFGTFSLSNGAVFTTLAQQTMRLAISSNLSVDALSRIDLKGKGYASTRFNGIGDGPGGGQGESQTGTQCATGAGYGGIGGGVGGGLPGGVYGSFANPADFGSAGGSGCGASGGSGGGAVIIEAGCIHVDGVIAADGENSGVRCWTGVTTGGGGSGGSINLRCQMLTGRGVIRANGAMGTAPPDCAGLGGGGRVAVYYGDMSGFTGTIQAWGGRNTNSTAQRNGGAGTVYLQRLSETLGTLTVDNGDAPTEGWSTILTNAGPVEIAELSLGPSAVLDVLTPLRVGKLVNLGTNLLRVLPGATVGAMALRGTNQLTFAGAGSFGTLSLSNGAILTTLAQQTMQLTVNSNLWVDALSRIDVSGKGYVSTTFNGIGDGPGGGQGEVETGGCGTGAGYGGVGGSVGRGAPGGVYGSFANPTDFGSAGGGSCGNRGGSGGGAMLIEAGRIHVDGVIAADGETSEVRCWFGVATASGGSGGSINLRCQALTGRGVIRANGALGIDPPCAGLGGGGRVAVYYGDKSGFTGTIQAWGGRNTNSTAQLNGGAGTVYLQKLSETQGALIVDNGGAPTEGWSTVLPSQGIIRLSSLTISTNARVLTTDGVRIQNGNPTQFQDLIRSNYLQVGGLLVSNTWVFGDVMDLVISLSNGRPGVTLYCQPGIPHLIQAATDFARWLPVFTNTPSGSSFDFIDTLTPSLGKRFYRAVRLEQVVTNVSLSINLTDRQALLTATVRPNQYYALDASTDLMHWSPLTNSNPATNVFQFLDTNGPSFDRRFYRVWGVGK